MASPTFSTSLPAPLQALQPDKEENVPASSIDGLALQETGQLALDPLSGHLFVFCHRRRTMVKVLYWDRNGFCLWQSSSRRSSSAGRGKGMPLCKSERASWCGSWID
ncbi:MAG: IS66 family insertion sequence element accessory protein TnpB [Deferrisomatales bacterium]